MILAIPMLIFIIFLQTNVSITEITMNVFSYYINSTIFPYPSGTCLFPSTCIFKCGHINDICNSGSFSIADVQNSIM